MLAIILLQKESLELLLHTVGRQIWYPTIGKWVILRRHLLAYRGGAPRGHISPTRVVSRIWLGRFLGIRVTIFSLFVTHSVSVFSRRLGVGVRMKIFGAIFAITLQLISVRWSIYIFWAWRIVRLAQIWNILRLSIKRRILVYLKLLFLNLLLLWNLTGVVPFRIPVQVYFPQAVLLFAAVYLGSILIVPSRFGLGARKLYLPIFT